MWHLDLKKIRKALPAGQCWGEVALETGTCRGNGTIALCRIFPRVITMELSPDLHRAARERFSSLGLTQVECWEGNSASLLPTILGNLPVDSKPFLFLDAHWSGDETVDWEASKWKGYGVDTAHGGQAGTSPSGPEQCPLLQEFEALNHFPGAMIVLVDDAQNIPPVGDGQRGVGFPGEDWTHLSREKLRGALGRRLEWEQDLKDPDQWLLCLSERRDVQP